MLTADAFDKAKSAYQAISTERIIAITQQKKLLKQVETIKSDMPQIEREIEDQRAAYDRLFSAVAAGDASEADLDDAEARIAGLEAKLKRKANLLNTAQGELRSLRVPRQSEARDVLDDLGKAYCAIEMEKRAKDLNKVKKQLVDLFGSWGIQRSDERWPEFLNAVFSQPDESALEGARDAFMDSIANPIEKSAIAALEDAT